MHVVDIKTSLRGVRPLLQFSELALRRLGRSLSGVRPLLKIPKCLLKIPYAAPQGRPEWCKELTFCQLLTPLGAALRSGVRPLAELE